MEMDGENCGFGRKRKREELYIIGLVQHTAIYVN